MVQKKWRNKRRKRKTSDVIVDVLIYVIIGLLSLTTLLPFLYILGGSFATEKELTEKAFVLIPEVKSLNAYKYVVNNGNILRGLRNSIIVTVMGTVVSMALSLTFAYPLSKKFLRGRNLVLNLVIVTMLFSGGMIPTYLVMSSYGLYNTWWALILIGAISPTNMIIIKNFFTQMPQELEDAAVIDGCGEVGVFARIVLPLSKPVIASISLFYGVGYWNDYFNAMIYLQDGEKYTVQIILRNIMILSSSVSDLAMDYYDMNGTPPEKGVKMAATVIATVPILCVYPFVQKYFTKGVMMGAVKG